MFIHIFPIKKRCYVQTGTFLAVLTLLTGVLMKNAFSGDYGKALKLNTFKTVFDKREITFKYPVFKSYDIGPPQKWDDTLFVMDVITDKSGHYPQKPSIKIEINPARGLDKLRKTGNLEDHLGSKEENALKTALGIPYYYSYSEDYKFSENIDGSNVTAKGRHLHVISFFSQKFCVQIKWNSLHESGGFPNTAFKETLINSFSIGEN
jgi:hypothetical protein